MNVYGWKSGSRIKVNAQQAGELFEQLETVTPETVLEAAKSEDSPIHSAFEWDDTAAAEKYRLSQAGHLIRCLTVTVTEEENIEPQRAYFKIADEGYEQTKAIMHIEEKRISLLQQALSELKAFQRKYSMLTELAKVFAEIEKTIEEETA